jgi:DNA-nicking Smr family endonuclease
MAKKRRTPERRDSDIQAPNAPKQVFTSPFKELGKLLRGRQALKPSPAAVKEAPAPAPKPADTDQLDEAALLRQALEGVRPLTDAGPARMPVQPPVSRTIVSEDAEVLARLSDLVSGEAPFDITETEEYTEGMRVGLDPRLVVRLRRGEFPVQARIDLHGMVQSAAKEPLAGFVRESARKGLRTVLVVHGKGRGSPGGHPVLKRATAQWLSHGALSGQVLAFTTARPADGGAGAMYVLLKRDRRRGAFDVLSGAKRRD